MEKFGIEMNSGGIARLMLFQEFDSLICKTGLIVWILLDSY